MKKICFKCKVEKELSDFYKHKMMADGHLNKCKECAKSDVSSHRAANIERIRAYDRERGGESHRVRANTERTRLYREAFPLKYKAHNKVARAIESGIIVKPKVCQACHKKGRQIEGHHDNYNKPLDVVWMCSACHSALHRDLKQ